MTSKNIHLQDRQGRSASYRASTSGGRQWAVSRIDHGFFGNSYVHVGNAGSLDDAVTVAKAAWGYHASKVSIR